MLSQIIFDQNNLPLHKIKEMYRVILIGKKNESVVSWSLFYAETSLEQRANLVINYIFHIIQSCLIRFSHKKQRSMKKFKIKFLKKDQ